MRMKKTTTNNRYLADGRVKFLMRFWRIERKGMPYVVREFVTDRRTSVCKSMLGSWVCIDKKNLKQTSVGGGTELLGRNINLENTGKVLRTCASNRRKADGRVSSWFTDGLEASDVHSEAGKHGHVLKTWRRLGCFGLAEVRWEYTRESKLYKRVAIIKQKGRDTRNRNHLSL